MGVFRKELEISTSGEGEIIDITRDVEKIIGESKLKNGLACVFVAGSTGAVTTIEYELGLLEDLPTALERLYPKKLQYKHHLRWGDGNGHSHIRASMIGPSLTVPFANSVLTLGTWQQIVFIELDIHSRKRKIIVQLVGE